MPTELEAVPHTAIAVTPMTLIERAVASGAPIEQLQQLFELKLRVEADEARKAFSIAMSDFKRNPPQLNKNKHVKFGQTEYDHATLDHVVDAITPALSQVGIRHRWETDQKDAGWVTVTCILAHEMGHSESTTLKAQVDSSGSKNAIQAIGSTITYLQRYTLLAATGLAAAGTDNDGRKAAPTPAGPQMDVEEYANHIDNIEGAAQMATLREVYKAAYKHAEAIGDQVALKAFVKAYETRKKELA